MYNELKNLIGKTLTDISKGEDYLLFITNDGEEYRMAHDQDCCESVYLEDICGDLQDLIGTPIIEAEEVQSCNENPEGVPVKEYQDDSFTWTFYKFRTAKGYVTLRWYGSSNGYYSERVDVTRVR